MVSQFRRFPASGKKEEEEEEWLGMIFLSLFRPI